MNKIAVVLPTRNRPHLLERFCYSVFENALNLDNVKIYLYIDEDDNLTNYGLKNIEEKYPNKIYKMIGPRILMSETANKLLPMIKEDIFYLGADDLIIRTKGWDDLIINKFNEIEDKIALLYGDDCYHAFFATHPILHRRWVEQLGYLTPPYFSSDYADTWLNDVSDKLGRKYKLPFVNEHMHFTFGKAPVDMTYAENRNRYVKDNPMDLYNRLADKRQEDVSKLLKIMKAL